MGLGLVAALACLPRPAVAGTIVTAEDTSFSGTYKLTGTSGSNDIYTFVLSATFGPSASSDYAFIHAVAFQMGSLTDANYTETPTVVGPGPNTWSVEAGGLNAGGCDGSGSAFWCGSPSGLGAPVGANGTSESWTFTLSIPNTDALSSTSESSDLKVQFTDAQGNKVGTLISQPITFTACTGTCSGGGGSVPEPASVILLGTGLAALVARRRRHTGKEL